MSEKVNLFSSPLASTNLNCLRLPYERYFDIHDPAKMSLLQTPPDDLADIPEIALTMRSEEQKMTDDEEKRLAIRAIFASLSWMQKLGYCSMPLTNTNSGTKQSLSSGVTMGFISANMEACGEK